MFRIKKRLTSIIWFIRFVRLKKVFEKRKIYEIWTKIPGDSRLFCLQTNFLCSNKRREFLSKNRKIHEISTKIPEDSRSIWLQTIIFVFKNKDENFWSKKTKIKKFERLFTNISGQFCLEELILIINGKRNFLS